MRKFLRQTGLNLKVRSSKAISCLISIFSIYLIDLLEKGSFACSHPSQQRSYEQTERVSGKESPWSIGTRVRTLTLGLLLDCLLETRILHSFLSKFNILMSKIAILCISSIWNKSGEKFSIGPEFSIYTYNEPNFKPISYS